MTGNRIGEIGGTARLDLDRRRRTAVPEVVFAEGKTEEQTLQLLAAQRRGDPGFPALATRCPAVVLQRVAARFPDEPVVAGLHRLLAQLDELSAADCVIAIAGMEDTLPGVVAGLIAPGLSVVNIDNGFGAAAHAVKIVARVHGG